MMGTLATVVAGKGLQTGPAFYRAEIAGDIEAVDGVLKIARIFVHYFLKATEAQQQDALDAMKTYLSRCPAAQSVIGCIELTDKLTFESMR